MHREMETVNGAQIERQMPYVMEAAMEVVRREKPSLFPTSDACAVQAAASASGTVHAEPVKPALDYASMESAIIQIVDDLVDAPGDGMTADTSIMDAAAA